MDKTYTEFFERRRATAKSRISGLHDVVRSHLKDIINDIDALERDFGTDAEAAATVAQLRAEVSGFKALV